MRNEMKSAPASPAGGSGGEEKKKQNKRNILMIITVIAAVIIAFLAAVIIYLIFRSNGQPAPASSPSTSASASETATASPKKRVGWETYNNSRFSYSVQVPPNLDKTESQNGDGAAFTTWDPPMTIRVSGAYNSLNHTAQQAIDFDKNDLATNEVENLKVIVEGPIEMGGQAAVESVWQYTAPSTGDASTSARAYTIKNNIVYKIEFLIATDQWNSYPTMFDDIFDSFKFL